MPRKVEIIPKGSETQVLSLPREILFEIAEHIFRDDDLNSLVRTCRVVFGLLNSELYKRSCRKDNFAILWAAKRGSIATVERAIRMGADTGSSIKFVSDASLLRRSPNFGLIQACHDIHKKTPLILAAEGGHNEIIRLLLQDTKNAEIKAPGGMAIHLATLNGHASTVQLLLSFDPTWVATYPTPGQTLLHVAASNGHVEVVSLLLDHNGVKVNAADPSGHTALHLAAKHGHALTVQALLDHDNTNVNIKDGRGNTPLHWAMKNQHMSTIEMLLNHSRTDVNICDRHGLQPLHLAARMSFSRPSP